MPLALLQSSIRRRLFALALSLAVPLAAVAAVRAVERRTSEQTALAARGMSTARQAAQLLEDDVGRVHTLLLGMSRLLDVTRSIAHNDSLIRALLRDPRAGMSNLWITDSVGNLRGSLVPYSAISRPQPLIDREYFQRAIQTREFYVGQPVRSRVLPGEPYVLPFALPVFHETDGRLIAMVGAGMLVDSLAAIRVVRDLPAGSVLTVLRADGRVMLRSADLDTWLGRNFSDTSAVKANGERAPTPDGSAVVRSQDGTERLVAEVPLREIGGGLFVGVPTSATLEQASRQFKVDVLLGLLITGAAMIVALVMARRISEPLLALTDVARAFTRGERDRRLTSHGDDEVSVLSTAFNQLADTVQDRERALAESEARYRQLFDSNPLPVVTWFVVTGVIDQINDAAREFLGSKRLSREPLRILDLIHPRERARFADLHLPAQAQSAAAGTWTQIDASGTERMVELIIGSFERDGAAVAAAVMVDLTDRLRAERDLEASREQLRQSQKMEALGSFAGGIAHDFNNYLSAIATNAEMLRDDLPIASPQRAEAVEILRSAQRAAALTRQILVFSSRQIPQEERLDVNAVIRDIEPLVQRLIGEHIVLRVSLVEGAATVLLDRGRLEQVVINLAANARDAMRSGGTLTITTKRDAIDTVRLEVADTGEGIPANVRARMFEPFFSTKERGRGTGLGLSIVDSIVSSAHGRIDIDSVEGEGTRFCITLPSAAVDELGVAQADAQSEAPVGGSETILLVEDDDAVRTSTGLSLARAGYHVLSAASGREALSVLAEQAPSPALLLTDVVMPEMSGPTLAAIAVRERPALHVVFMSGYADDDVLMEGLERQAVNFVAKPFSRAELLRMVRRTLDRPQAR